MLDVGIRNAQRKDVDLLAELVYSTEKENDNVWGGKNKKENIYMIKKLMFEPKSLYSLKYINVIEYKNNIAGMLITIPYKDLDELFTLTLKLTFKHLKGLKRKSKFFIENFTYSFVRLCNKDDLYIANIATTKKVRGLGFGKILMEYAEFIAKINHCKRCVLLAKDEYTSNFYKKINYKIVKDKSLFNNNLIKMSKSLI